MKPEETIPQLLQLLPDGVVLDLDEGPYVILSEFAIILRDGIATDRFSESELESIFEFLNRLGASGDIEIENQLVVGVLEVLTDTSEAISVCRHHLTGKAKSYYERVLVGWQNG